MKDSLPGTVGYQAQGNSRSIMAKHYRKAKGKKDAQAWFATTPIYISAEDMLAELQKITLKLEAMDLARKDSDAGSVVWASQATLAKRYDMSKSNMCRLLLGGVSGKKIRTCQPNGGVRKYNVADVDAYLISITPSGG
ncbi:hypothetical protein [Akkermansia sp.]|uniref:hypothetical protein n=1 Tax=Akkermansia TaxID=239934 RepID=UPI0025BAC43C|nr:hypothetical protein [Akkermansia sp.]